MENARDLQLARTSTLEIAYEQTGTPDAFPVVLLHGFPYDTRAYDAVVPLVTDAGFRAIVPYLRGFGGTRFLSPDTMRSGQQAALGYDLLELLDVLDARQLPFGVVTNKPQHLTDPLLATLGLSDRLSCCVSGDTLAQRKPDPAPLLYGCEQAGVPPHRAVYVGDAARDIEAGRAAGMSTIAAAYGYIVPGDEPASWNADAIATDTKELAKILLKAVNLDA